MKVDGIKRSESARYYRQAYIEECELAQIESAINTLQQLLWKKKDRITSLRSKALDLQYASVEEPTLCKERKPRKPSIRADKDKKELLEHFKNDPMMLKLVEKL